MSGSDIFVCFDVGASGDEVDRVRATLADVGVAADVTDQPYTLTAAANIDVVQAFVVVATTAASGFLGAFAAKAGADAYERLRRLIDGLRTARQHDNGCIDIIIRTEVAGSPDIVIGPDTPPEALRTLLISELPPAPSGVIEYDRTKQRWTDSDSA